MRKITLKSVLMTALLGVSANAMADVTPYAQDYEADGVAVDWTTSVSGRFTPVILEQDGNHYLSVDQADAANGDSRWNNGCILSSTSLAGLAAEGDDFTLSFNLKVGNSTNQTPVEFNVYDAANSSKIFSLVATGTNSITWKVNNGDTPITLAGTEAQKDITALAWYSVTISRSGALTYVTIKNAADEEVLPRSIVATLSDKGGLGKMEFITKRYHANFAIDNVVLRELQDGDVPVVTATSYTIKFVDSDNNPIADDVVTSSVVGEEVTATAAQMAAKYIDEQKYNYVSGNETIELVEDAASNVITLVFEKAAEYTYTVNAVDAENNLLQTLYTGKAFDKDNLHATYPLYVYVGGQLYTKAATSQSYFTDVIVDADDFVVNYVYTPTDINNVVYFAEAESIEGVSTFNGANANARSSNATVAWVAGEESLLLTTLPAGDYVITGVGFFPTSGGGTKTILAGENTILTITGKSSNWTNASAEFSLTEETSIYLAAGGSKDDALDFIYIQQVMLDAVEFVLGESESFASYVPSYAADFKASGVTAYVATAAVEGVVTLESVEAVPAGTPVLVKGTKGATVEIKKAAAAEAPAANLLKAATGAVLNENQYVLAYTNEEFIFAHLDGAIELPAGKVYLEVEDAGEVKAFRIGGTATAVESVKAAQADGRIFNLAGQRVNKAQKGIYVVNGKKIVK